MVSSPGVRCALCVISWRSIGDLSVISWRFDGESAIKFDRFGALSLVLSSQTAISIAAIPFGKERFSSDKVILFAKSDSRDSAVCVFHLAYALPPARQPAEAAFKCVLADEKWRQFFGFLFSHPRSLSRPSRPSSPRSSESPYRQSAPFFLSSSSGALSF